MASSSHQFWGKTPTSKWGLIDPGAITAGYSCFSHPKSPMPEDMGIPCFSNHSFLSLSGISCRMRLFPNFFFNGRQVSSGSWELFLTIPWLILLGISELSLLIPRAFSLGKTRNKCFKGRFTDFFGAILTSEMWQIRSGERECGVGKLGFLRGNRQLFQENWGFWEAHTALQRALVPLPSPQSTFFWLLMA